MADTGPDPEETKRRFDQLRWHDAKLLDFSFHRNSANENEVTVSLEFPEEGGWSGTRVMTFIDSTCVRMEIDLEGKRVCSDAIESARCVEGSDWLRALSEASPHDHFEDYLHFRIALIHPGGAMDILAKGFTF